MSRAFAICALFLGAVAAQAAILYNARTTFSAALGTSFTDGYEAAGYQVGDLLDLDTMDRHSNDHMSNVVGQTRYTTTGFTNQNLILDASAIPAATPGRLYCAGCNGSFVLDFTSTGYGTADGVFGVGIDFFNRLQPYFAFVTYGDGSTENIALPFADFNAFGFWGITSASRIKSIAFGLTGGQDTVDGHFGIDNLTIGSQAQANVPEPASLLLVGLALAAMPRRRRTRL